MARKGVPFSNPKSIKFFISSCMTFFNQNYFYSCHCSLRNDASVLFPLGLGNRDSFQFEILDMA